MSSPAYEKYARALRYGLYRAGIEVAHDNDFTQNDFTQEEYERLCDIAFLLTKKGAQKMDRYILTPKAKRRREIIEDIEFMLAAASGALFYAVVEALIRAVLVA